MDVTSRRRGWRSVQAAWLIGIGVARAASAQGVAPGSVVTTNDTPSIRVGAMIFANYTYQIEPEIIDTGRNIVNYHAFDVTRAYINVSGSLSRIVAFRVTPDVRRETNSGTAVDAGLTFRIKYAYLQTNFDDWMTRGSFARFGIQPTPYLDYTEIIYRYRFQGTMFAERANYFNSADAGASFHWNLPSDYGDIHVGIFNGENYNRPEVNDQKAIMIRLSVRPFATTAPILRGLRATVFYDGDSYVENAERTRAIGQVTFEHPRVVAGFEYLSAKDRAPTARTAIESSGYSIWLTPRSSIGWEALLRYDHLAPDRNPAFESRKQDRTIIGVAYWFPHQGDVSAALMLDYDAESLRNTASVATRSMAIHALVSF